MGAYRFSPIADEAELRQAVGYLHTACYELCLQSLGVALDVLGNVGVFTHYEAEYERLTVIRRELTFDSDNPDTKYFVLREPIVIDQSGRIPEGVYTHLYIRRPDPYRHHVGDIDFVVGNQYYDKLRTSVSAEELVGARVFPRADLDMVELFDPDVDVLGYVSRLATGESARVKLSDETRL
jgi:hypothetical protein